MTLTIAEARSFIVDADKSREAWLTMAKRSWNEIKKRQKNNNLWSITPNSLRKRAKYPAWYSIFKIRQPLLLSRIGIPICRDTTQDGNDTVGATAALIKERLAVNLAKSFDFFDVLCAVRDDFLATSFGCARAYYERTEVKEQVKERITPQKIPGTEETAFVDAQGKIIESDDIGQDDEGFFIEHDQVVAVDNERVYLEPVLYSDVYVDPDIKRWKRCKRIAFADYYSRPEFVEVFGAKALATLPPDTSQSIHAGNDDAAPKRRTIKVYEYWDMYEQKPYWWADEGEDFIEPVQARRPDEEQEGDDEARVGLYDLSCFFPCPTPLVTSQATDEYWPVPEYYHVIDIVEDIHQIFSRMFALTKAIRARLLYDSDVEGLQSALNEAAEGDAIGVANLAQALVGAGGSLENVVQYIPVEKLIQSLENMYRAFEQRLNCLYKLTGTSDLLQGLITDPTQRTLGERQMTEKYAINQVAEPQRKMQEYVRDCYELITEMAIKNFNDASLDRYIMPVTLPKEHQGKYKQALGMLKEDWKRFRIELETDSTIALNEQYDKEMRRELVDTLTNAVERSANIAQTSPAMVAITLHSMKFLIQGMRQAKMFQQEISEAIDGVIKQAESAPPAFNKDEATLQAKTQLEQAKLSTSMQQFMIGLQSKERIEAGKNQLKIFELQQKERLSAVTSQIEIFKAQIAGGKDKAALQLEYQKLSAAIAEAQTKLTIERDALGVELRKVVGDEQVKQFQLMIQQQTAPYEAQLRAQELMLEQMRIQADIHINTMENDHMTGEMANEQMRMALDAKQMMLDANKPPESPIHMNVDARVAPIAKKVEVKKDKFGNVRKYKASETPITEK